VVVPALQLVFLRKEKGGNPEPKPSSL